MSRPFIGRSGNNVVIRSSGIQSTACTQYGGAYVISTAKAEPATMNPEMNITKKAGPSAESAKEKSSQQCSQRGASARKPANSLPFPQRGQRPHRPAMTGDGGFCEEGSASCPISPKLHQFP